MTIIRKVIPNKLTHYTNVGGLIGILESSSLWASHVSFLNDKRELQHGLDATQNVLEEYYRGRGGIHISIVRNIIEDLRHSKLPDIYATCFCRADDLLSQWRGYGGKEQGVSITFNGLGLSSLFRKHEGTAMEVIYDKERTASRVKSVLRNALDVSGDLFGPLSSRQEQEKLSKLISGLVPRFKDDGFAEEDEWRFVIQRKDDFGNVKFRDRDGVIIPYLIVKEESGRLPIGHITVGPGKNQDITMKSIEIFLRARGYENVDVRASSVPYRT